MKKYFLILSAFTLLSLVACGPSQEEIDKQKRIDDSLMEPERNNALDNTNKLLMEDSASSDTTAKNEAPKTK